MCGIAGLIRFTGEPVDAPAVSAMADRLAHRGPDDQGVFVQGNVGLGHHRLSIIDPEGGAQPFVSEDGQTVLVFNGEIYNFIELRTALQGRGHRFRTASDSEVLLHCWREWGTDCVSRLRGMFAFGVIDLAARTCFLARDPFGIKPLFYALSGEELAFASELHPLSSRRAHDIDLRMVDRYLHRGFITAPDTVYTGINKLLPGQWLSLGLDGGRVRRHRYWRMAFEPERGRRTDSWLEELEQVLVESVALHLRADVPCGAFLSGGIDSTVITALMQRVSDSPVPSYSIGFDAGERDETAWAMEASRRIGTRHRVEYDRCDPFAQVLSQIKHFGEPFADWSSVPTEQLSKLAREDVSVVLSGDGGDELFAGYRRYQNWMKNRTLTWDKTMLQCMDTGYRYSLWRPEFHYLIEQNDAASDDDGGTRLDRLSGAQLRDLTTYLPDSVLCKVDITSMMHGLEVRTPFLDVHVAELVGRIPPEELARLDANGGWQGKRLLKSFLDKRIQCGFGPDFIHRPKMGFIPPVKELLLENPHIRRRVEETLSVSGSRLGDFFAPGGVSSLFENLDRGGGAEPIWALWVLKHWLETA